MLVLKAYKTELAPNNRQVSMMGRYCGASRYVFNWGLAEWKGWYEAGDKPSRFKLCKHFNSVKDEVCPWIRAIPYAVTEAAFVNLGNAFKHFFRRVKNGEEPGYPKFKKKKGNGGFQLRCTKIELDRVRLTGIGWVRLKERGYIPIDGDYGVYATVSESGGRWFISVLVKEDMPEPKPSENGVIGVDFGIKQLATCSDGTIFESSMPLRKAEHKLARLQRELSRRKRGGQNWKKTKRKIAKLHARIAHIRQHALHDVSYHLTAKTKPSAVVIENLNVSGMLKNRHLSKAISDMGFYELRRQLEYKGAWYGVEVMTADRWYPSSKTCSACGAVKPLLKLSERTFVCEECGAVIDRDQNAALNLASLIIEQKAETQPDCLLS